ncbi:uncharacterized protein KQ657_001009 [Scheffersomyces spartinae]|uniref:SRP9 domain-containing protein n=1 Tax=Scheffersomyces spartinae TaxID=45513 RepID=A0A9P7V8M8_9ASCO|nr:uncharacterized protein KQ657_001009 [Scheffersomyces spartinae]KAG7193247.1 hypothetical protein KQ657_001009 [Scheffersomyces spartinae]
MPYVKEVESFIERLANLLSTYPTTRLSITYSNVSKKHRTTTRSLSATHRVTFKCFEPASGKCLKFRTSKVKEFSRLMTFVGPRGVNHDTVNGLGLALVMANARFEGTPVEVKESTPVVLPEPSGVSKTKKKKKGRK